MLQEAGPEFPLDRSLVLTLTQENMKKYNKIVEIFGEVRRGLFKLSRL